MKKYLSISIASILALSAPGIAKAQFSVTAQVGGVPTVSGATLETFNEPSPAILTLSGSANLVTGANSGVAYFPPYFTDSTAAFFGESPTTGSDSSQYVAIWDSGSATLSFATPQHYLGLVWGSVDPGNSLTFYDNANNVIGTVLGTDVTGVVYDDIGPNSTAYVNIISTTAFSSVVATSTWNSFEFDDVAYAPVPEPASGVLFSAGFCIVGFALRRKFA
jgi:hypothetical protein